MRALATQEEKVLANGVPIVWPRVRVKDAGGTFRDLTALFGKDWLQGVEVTESIDAPVKTSAVSVTRDSYKDSLAPLMQASRANLLTGSYAALLQPGREFVVETATVPQGVTPAAGDWKELFRGDIDKADSASAVAQFSGRDLGGRLQDLWIRSDTTYAAATAETTIQKIIKDAHGTAWASGQTLALRDRTTPVTQNGFWYRVTTAGTSGTAEPSWGTTIGGTTAATGGTAVWTCYGECPTLYTPVGTGVTVPAFIQRPMNVLEALRAIVLPFGWDIRYKWRAGTSKFELTLYAPERGKTTPDYTFSADRYLVVERFEVSRQDIRNSVSVVYSDPADLDEKGVPKRKTVTVQDATSQDKYTLGLPAHCQIAEDATSQIDTSGEATTLANHVLSDLKDPIADAAYMMSPFYVAELGDLYRFSANDVTNSANQDLAVTEIRHVFVAAGLCSTSVSVRGKPAGAHREWLQMEAGDAIPARFGPPAQPTGVSISKVVGGVSVQFAAAADHAEDYELHVSTSASFTPSSSTFKTAEKTTKFVVADLTPGTTYYAKVVPRDRDGNRGTASSEVTIAAGYTTPTLMQPQVVYNRLPPNPDFEAQSDSASPPDAWSIPASSGTWNTNIFSETSTIHSGSRAVKFVGATSATRRLVSQLIPVRPGSFVAVRVMAKWSAAGGALEGVRFGFEEFSDLTTSLAEQVQILDNLTTSYAQYEYGLVANASTKYVRVVVGSIGNVTIFVDTVALDIQNPDWKDIVLGSNYIAYVDATYTVAVPGYCRDSAGIIHLRGVAKNTPASNVGIGSLPVGYRPKKDLFLGCNKNHATFEPVVVTAGGSINLRNSPTVNDYFSLDGISFPAEQ